MILDPRDRLFSMFESTNGLVEDPKAELEAEDLVKIWTPDEKRIFMEKFLLFPKVHTGL